MRAYLLAADVIEGVPAAELLAELNMDYLTNGPSIVLTEANHIRWLRTSSSSASDTTSLRRRGSHSQAGGSSWRCSATPSPGESLPPARDDACVRRSHAS